MQVLSLASTITTPVYVYEFVHPAACPGWPVCQGLACHTAELPYVFNQLETIHVNYSAAPISTTPAPPALPALPGASGVSDELGSDSEDTAGLGVGDVGMSGGGGEGIGRGNCDGVRLSLSLSLSCQRGNTERY